MKNGFTAREARRKEAKVRLIKIAHAGHLKARSGEAAMKSERKEWMKEVLNHTGKVTMA